MTEGLALIIEDSFTQSQIIARMLNDQDWRTVHARSLEEGLQAIIRHKPGLIFVDVFLGEDNSLSALPQIRELANDAAIAVMTAGNRAEDINHTLDEARRARADYVLQKPFSRKQIGAIVAAAEQDYAQGSRRRHALVVEDSQTVLKLTAQMLEDSGFRVSTAQSMEEALTNVDIGHIDVAVCDIFMPGIGGLEGIKRIKRSWPSVKVLAMSAGLGERISPERAVSAALQAGADAEISKPFTAMAFANAVAGLMVA